MFQFFRSCLNQMREGPRRKRKSMKKIKNQICKKPGVQEKWGKNTFFTFTFSHGCFNACAAVNRLL